VTRAILTPEVWPHLERFRPVGRQVVGVDAEALSSVSAPIDPLLRAAKVRSVGSAANVNVAALFRDNRSRLRSLAYAITFDQAVAEEVVQEAFVGLQRHITQIDNPLGYVQRSVVNLSVSSIRRRRRAARHPIPPPVPASSPEIDEIWSRVVRLPAKQRAVVVLRFWEDMTVDAIADTLGRPSGSVKSTLHRALEHLKEELQ
jgi:RNA polymerase sigma factor (sigma-70 family)